MLTCWTLISQLNATSGDYSHNLPSYTLYAVITNGNTVCRVDNNALIRKFHPHFQNSPSAILRIYYDDMTSPVARQVSKPEGTIDAHNSNRNYTNPRSAICLSGLWSHELLFTERYPCHFTSVLANLAGYMTRFAIRLPVTTASTHPLIAEFTEIPCS